MKSDNVDLKSKIPVFPQNGEKYGSDQPRMRTLLSQYCKFTAISWLNDFEDMK